MKRKSVREILDNYFESESYKKQSKLEEERKQTVKSGNNVLHLEFLGELQNDELIEIEKKLKQTNLELSYYNKSGVFFNDFDQYSLITYFVINQVLILEILKSIGMSATWDSIKWVLLFGWKKLRGKKFYKSQGNEITEKKVKFGFQVILDGNTQFNFELDGDLDKEIIEKSLDKALNFLNTQKLKESYKIPDYVSYSKDKDEWIKIDVDKTIQNKLKKRKKKKKKK